MYDVIKSKSKRNNSSERLIEQIMFKYLELCVDLKKSHVAKEGLFQYRNMCQATNVASLAAVVQGYLNLAEKRTDTAKQESQDSAQEVIILNYTRPTPAPGAKYVIEIETRKSFWSTSNLPKNFLKNLRHRFWSEY